MPGVSTKPQRPLLVRSQLPSLLWVATVSRLGTPAPRDRCLSDGSCGGSASTHSRCHLEQPDVAVTQDKVAPLEPETGPATDSSALCSADRKR